MYTLRVANRDYTQWSFILDDHSPIESSAGPTISPLEAKLFHGDQVDSTGKLITSPYRIKEHICGVLLTSQKTYGRASTSGKLLYKCVPDDEHLPCFLIPYEEKNIGFSKTRTDKYISFRLTEWTATTKHPRGLITNTFGEVEDKEAYVAYQMACQEINDSMKTLNAASLRVLRENVLKPIPLYCAEKAIDDRRALRIISIDPVGCADMDDAIGIQTLDDTQTVLSVYIANVPVMLEYLNLWSVMTERIATIYLPEKKIPMLPVSLSDNLCSLREKEDRIAFVMDIHLKYMAIQNITFKSTIIRVEKNYTYEAAELLGREDYKSIVETVRDLNRYFRYVDRIATSHDVIEYCMLFMNRECAKQLRAQKCGIFRSASKKTTTQQAEQDNYSKLSTELKSILQNTAGEYTTVANIKPHDLIGNGLDCYLHITSPIRRVVDVVNMLAILQPEFPWSAAAKEFMEKWQGLIPMLNKKNKAIRRLQNEMELLATYEKNKDQTYQGFIFQRNEIPEKNVYKYRAYIPATKLLTSVLSSKDRGHYAEVHFSAHLFLDEAKMTKKIRLQII
jgi:exoribonuclease R